MLHCAIHLCCRPWNVRSCDTHSICPIMRLHATIWTYQRSMCPKSTSYYWLKSKKIITKIKKINAGETNETEHQQHRTC